MSTPQLNTEKALQLIKDTHGELCVEVEPLLTVSICEHEQPTNVYLRFRALITDDRYQEDGNGRNFSAKFWALTAEELIERCNKILSVL